MLLALLIELVYTKNELFLLYQMFLSHFTTLLEQSIEILLSHQNVLHCVPFSVHNICCCSFKSHSHVYVLMYDIPILI